MPVTHPFQQLAIDLVMYKTTSLGAKYVLSAVDHLTIFAISVGIEEAVAEALVDRLFSIFGPPETLLL
ncbi:unnamed protein product [Choristocarpus tenellus]